MRIWIDTEFNEYHGALISMALVAMAQYRKKPVVIEAFQWTGGHYQTEDPVWACEAILAGSVRFENLGTPDAALLIDTLEGTHRANQGDWIIRGIKGELYPCKPDIFAATYEAA